MGAKHEKSSRDAAVVIPARIRLFSEELSRVMDGWRHLDCDVRVDGELVAELLGKIGERLVFVHHLVGSKEEVTLGALRHVSRARTDARLLAPQFAVPVDIEPLVVVITEGKTKWMLKRLQALCPDPLTVFAERRFSSVGRRARFLEELTPATVVVAPPSSPAEAAPKQLEESVESVPAWDAVIARVDRIDPGLERTGGESEMRWSWGGETLCCIAVDLDGHFVGRIGPDGVQHNLGTRRAVEVFFDWVLAHHLELLEGGEDERLRDVELMPHPSEPLLTPEELAAFQE